MLRSSRHTAGACGRTAALGLVSAAVFAAALWTGGGWELLTPAAAAPPGAAAEETAPAVAAGLPSDYSRRVVAYIHDNIPITREDLGEYLIARQGADKLDLLVNKKIIERACQQKGVEVTAREVEAAFEEDYKGLGLDRNAFVQNLLKQHYKKTLYEWKEDVIRPRLLLAKLCRDRVAVTDEDVNKAFESHYGERVECRIIMVPRGEEKHAFATWEKVRNNDEEFERASRNQANGRLAAVGGSIKPIGRYSSNDQVEKEAFRLQPGEVSSLIEGKEGILILKCVKRIPPDTTKHVGKERPALEKEIREKKIQETIPVVFQELREAAKPKVVLKGVEKEEDLLREVRESIQEDKKAGTAGGALKPVGN